MTAAPLVTVICVNFQGLRVLPACLTSLRRQTCPPQRVIVVDNASTDGSRELVRHDFPEVELLESSSNLGFGAGNNLALDRAATPYVLLVNNDAVLADDCLAELVRTIELDPFAGAVAAKVLLQADPAAPLRIDAAGLEICADGLALGRGRFADPAALDEPTEVFFPSGCCGLYRREMLDDLRLEGEIFDEDFFAYAEDTDLGWRAQLAGWKTLYAPRAICYHRHSATTGSVHPRKVFLVERNRVWVAFKNFPTWLLLWGLGYTAARYFWQAWATLAGRGRAGEFRRQNGALTLLGTLLLADAAALWGLPGLVRKRWLIRCQRRLTCRQIRAVLQRFGLRARDVALRD